jgi:APA family basic amino acid/polyamine antiporter
MTDTGRPLKKSVDLWGVVALGLGTAVGVAIFSVIAPATGLGGPGMLLAVLIAAVPMFIIALSYAFIGSVLPTSGASFEWPSRFLHPAVGFGIAWLRIAGTTGAMIVLALVFTRYLSMLVPVPTKPTMAALFTLVLIANLLGVGIAAGVQKLLMALLLAVFAVYLVWGAPSVSAAHFDPFLSHGMAGVLATVPLLIGLFFGIEAATEVGEEVSDSKRNIPLGIAVSMGSALALYLLVAGVAVGVAGPEAIAASETPLLTAAQVFMGPVATPLIVAAGVLAIGKSLNALFLIFSRSLFAMARAGMLPAVLTRVHAARGTPWAAVLAVYGFCLAGLLLPTGLTFLFLAVNIPTLLKYASICAAADRIVVDHPEIYARAPFRLSRRWTRIVAWTGIVGAVAIILLGVSTDWQPYAALAVWGVVGIGVYLLRDRTRVATWLAGHSG